MAYGDFTLRDLEKKFGIQEERVRLFSPINIPNVPPTQWLLTELEESDEIPNSSEKSKSELMISPVLKELWRNTAKSFNLFSGYTFDVDKKLGLTGVCDYLLTQRPRTSIIKSPVFCAVEAKSRAIEEGTGQAGAEMLAAQIYNEREGNPTPTVFGCVTNGVEWGFLKLENSILSVDIDTYYADKFALHKLLGVLQYIADFYKK
ncbi:MAG: hypothetical protein MUF58_12385 [Arcicella sp.]|jgi:hypothetical protein|nr:hypothetical protein [Arcicella sp.]